MKIFHKRAHMWFMVNCRRGHQSLPFARAKPLVMRLPSFSCHLLRLTSPHFKSGLALGLALAIRASRSNTATLQLWGVLLLFYSPAMWTSLSSLLEQSCPVVPAEDKRVLPKSVKQPPDNPQWTSGAQWAPQRTDSHSPDEKNHPHPNKCALS